MSLSTRQTPKRQFQMMPLLLVIMPAACFALQALECRNAIQILEIEIPLILFSSENLQLAL